MTQRFNEFLSFFFQMTTYPSHFSQTLGNHGTAMAYLKASPTYHMNGLSTLGMAHGLDSLQSQSLHHYNGGKRFIKKSWFLGCVRAQLLS